MPPLVVSYYPEAVRWCISRSLGDTHYACCVDPQFDVIDPNTGAPVRLVDVVGKLTNSRLGSTGRGTRLRDEAQV